MALDAHSALLTGFQKENTLSCLYTVQMYTTTVHPISVHVWHCVCCAICCVSSRASRLNTCISVRHQ